MSDPPVEIVRSSRRHKTLSAQLVDGTIRVRVPAGMPASAEADAVAALVARVRRKISAAHIDLAERAASLAGRYGLPRPSSIDWSDRQNTRWGSCTPSRGTIRIARRLAGVPDWVLDYVIVHELAHLREPSHGPGFKDLVARYELSERATGYLLALNATAG